MSNRPKWNSLHTAGSVSRLARLGALYPAPLRVCGGNCTKLMRPSAVASCTRHSLSRVRFSPSVSVSIATLPAALMRAASSADRSFWNSSAGCGWLGRAISVGVMTRLWEPKAAGAKDI